VKFRNFGFHLIFWPPSAFLFFSCLRAFYEVGVVWGSTLTPKVICIWSSTINWLYCTPKWLLWWLLNARSSPKYLSLSQFFLLYLILELVNFRIGINFFQFYDYELRDFFHLLYLVNSCFLFVCMFLQKDYFLSTFCTTAEYSGFNFH
jgi:hypothetical protein